ncbi:hypothetical protein K491DRAFT_682446 [Lophiostoma macrostomum CBS 122681]|uniref:Uncharacterized protein n=1 Tax=Lophiostoma macrostomum CBS 122681 TaxID=1314788 RepID=A0A6A6SU27_9PLEO|nr:hypothetical protein K491DRAFT_682446 [Lophiostoma macrostomum CBS 122681]
MAGPRALSEELTLGDVFPFDDDLITLPRKPLSFEDRLKRSQEEMKAARHQVKERADRSEALEKRLPYQGDCGVEEQREMIAEKILLERQEREFEARLMSVATRMSAVVTRRYASEITAKFPREIREIIYGFILQERYGGHWQELRSISGWTPCFGIPQVFFHDFAGKQFAAEIREAHYRSVNFYVQSWTRLRERLTAPVGHGGLVVANLVRTLGIILDPWPPWTHHRGSVHYHKPRGNPREWYYSRAKVLALLLGADHPSQLRIYLELGPTNIRKIREAVMPVVYTMKEHGMTVSMIVDDESFDLDTDRPWKYWQNEFQANSAFVSTPYIASQCMGSFADAFRAS